VTAKLESIPLRRFWHEAGRASPQGGGKNSRIAIRRGVSGQNALNCPSTRVFQFSAKLQQARALRRHGDDSTDVRQSEQPASAAQ
jgi:hypothetical protein